MDTWATSSLTPQIAGRLGRGSGSVRARVPDGPAAAGARHHPHLAVLDRAAVAISSTTRCRGRTPRSPGWVLDPDRKKMSKSKGNVVTPMGLLEEHGSDGVRYWAASGRPGHRHGVRHRPDEGRPAAGDQAAERVEVRARPGRSRRAPSRSRSIAALLTSLRGARRGCDAGARGLRLRARARRRPRRSSGRSATTTSSWSSRGATATTGRRRAASANAALLCALSVLLRLFAPFLPFVTEEVWSWWQTGSVHRAPGRRAAEIDRRRPLPTRTRDGRSMRRSTCSARSGEQVDREAAAEGARSTSRWFAGAPTRDRPAAGGRSGRAHRGAASSGSSTSRATSGCRCR